MGSRNIAMVLMCLAVPAATLAQTTQSASELRDPAGLQRLQAQTSGAAVVGVHKATGAARFIRLQRGAVQGLASGIALTPAARQEHSLAFFREYAALLGISASTTMEFQSSSTDAIGETHLTWRQTYRGVPVFAGLMRTHFGSDGQLKAVTGTAVPDLSLSATPSVASRRAADAALSFVRTERGNPENLRTGTVRLFVYREGLFQGIPGENHLAWQVEVTDRAGIRDLVYVDAHIGKVIDTHAGIQDQLNRRAYDGHDLAFAPENYPHGAYWLEGQSFPTASTEANNMINASKEVYDLFNFAFKRDSLDGKGIPMDAIFDRGYSCPNASWNGIFISFCPGFTTDDVTAHEWGHAYTQYTHDLVYQWQPGALNESYSDIWGEVVDLLNTRGTDSPGGARTGACSTFSPPVGTLRVNSPATLAGDKFAQSAAFGAPLTETGVTESVVAALDNVPPAIDGCSELTNAAAVAGKIALVDRGTCEFSTKVLWAQRAGAIGVIIANNVSSGLPGMGAGVDAPLVTIPSLGILKADGDAMRAVLASPGGAVNATLLARPGTDASVRWLMGEDVATDDGTGALRDMSNPTCYGNPGKVTDTAYYVCSTADQGGVHTNSGIPNHAFALLVDGGSYNGETVAAIGLTKAAHLYFRAQTVYQRFDSDFADHADALEASCADLTGKSLSGLRPGDPSEVITPDDCAAVSAAIAAVELRTPAPCTFTPLLNPANRPMCSSADSSGIEFPIFSATFESGGDGFSSTTIPVGSGFTAREWTRQTGLPGGRAGTAFFAPDPNTSCEAGDESGLLQLTSPVIALPETTVFARATFEHWVATEPGWDGGNLKVSVNGGPWQLVPQSAYTFNGYTSTLIAAPQNTNPLAGQRAWAGNDGGTVNGGSWGRTHVNLAGFAVAGDNVQLRWEFGTDVCAGRTGWYVDNVKVSSCTPNIPAISAIDRAVLEGNADKRVVTLTVRLDKPTIAPVSVNYAVADGTALHGDDFLPVDDGVIVFPAGATSATVGITLKGDTTFEPDEVFYVNLSGAVNATIAKAQGVFTIRNDDAPPTPEP